MSDATSADVRWRWWHAALLGIAVAVALTIRLSRIDASPSFDEIWHLRLSAGLGEPLNCFKPDTIYDGPRDPTSIVGAPPIWRVWDGMDSVLHPPLYVVTLRLWREMFGNGNWVASVYSVAWSCVAIGFTFAAARLAMGAAVAFAVAIAMAASPTQVYFAQEIRAYAMLTGLVAIAAWLMTRLAVLGPSRGRAIALAATTLPMLLTHYFAFGAAIGIAIYGAWRSAGHRRAFLLTLAAAAVVYVVVWLPFAIRQIGALGTGDASYAVPHRDLWRNLLFAANGPFRLIADRNYSKEPTSFVAGALFVLPWLLTRRLRALAPWALVLATSLGGIVALDLARSTEVIHVTRYLGVASPLVFLLFAGCGAAIDRRLGAIVAAGVAIMGSIYLYARLDVELDVQSFGAVPAELARHAKAGEPLAVYGGEHETFYGDFVLATVSNAVGVPSRPYVNLQHPVSPAMRERLGPRLWLCAIWNDPPPEVLVPGARVLYRKVLDLDLNLYYLALDGDATTQRSSRELSGPTFGPTSRPSAR